VISSYQSATWGQTSWSAHFKDRPGGLFPRSARILENLSPLCVVLTLFLLAFPARGANYTIQTVTDAAPPKELDASIRKLLGTSCVQLRDADGNAVMELWLRVEVPVKATEAQIKNGLTYREVPVSTVMGALNVLTDITDYRKQKIPAGVYTLRIALQPVSDDHLGKSMYRDFCLLCPASEDKSPELLADRKLYQLSAKVTEEHPGVFMLFPGKGATAAAKLVDKGGGHRVLLIALPARAGEHKATLPLGLTLVGTSPAL
jgi:hypothetical protein